MGGWGRQEECVACSRVGSRDQKVLGTCWYLAQPPYRLCLCLLPVSSSLSLLLFSHPQPFFPFSYPFTALAFLSWQATCPLGWRETRDGATFPSLLCTLALVHSCVHCSLLLFPAYLSGCQLSPSMFFSAFLPVCSADFLGEVQRSQRCLSITPHVHRSHLSICKHC